MPKFMYFNLDQQIKELVIKKKKLHQKITKIYSLYYTMLIYFLRAKEIFFLLGTCDNITVQTGFLKNAVCIYWLFFKGVDLSAFTQSKFLKGG